MHKSIAAFCLTIVTVSVLACSSVKNRMVTAENKDKIFEEIKSSKDLTIEEGQLLQAYLMRYQLVKNLAAADRLPIEGKSIGELIDAQRLWAESLKVKEAAEKEAREKAKAAEEQQRAVLLQALTVTLYDKGFARVDYQDYITFKLSYENKSGKEIRGFKGSLVLKDLFGDLVHSGVIKEDSPIKAGETSRVGRSLNYNQFIQEHKRLASTDLQNLKSEWHPELIMFTDGTSLKIDLAPTAGN